MTTGLFALLAWVMPYCFVFILPGNLVLLVCIQQMQWFYLQNNVIFKSLCTHYSLVLNAVGMSEGEKKTHS